MASQQSWGRPSSRREARADVAIVGFGPVGAVLAGLLGRRGLDVVVVERERQVFGLPRAAHVDHTGLRTLQELGCLDDLLPTMLPNPGLDFVTADGELLMRLPGNQGSVSSLPGSMYFHQPQFDQRLREVCDELPNVTVHLGVEAIGLVQNEDKVEITLTNDAGEQEMLRADWLVGCDGASSVVRQVTGMVLDDLRFEERWLVVDLKLDEPVPSLPQRAVTVCDPRRPVYSIPMPPPRHRFEFMLRDEEQDAAALDPSMVQSLMAPWLAPQAASVERSAVYTFHGLVAKQWRRDRILIAGDAAHQMPPFLGQGMCSGIRDASNLAWKLEAVIRKGAAPALLDTYRNEREPHVRTIVEAAVRFGQLICTVDPVKAAERDRAMLADGRDATERVPFSLPPLSPGPLVVQGGGELFVQPASINGGPHFDDLIGPRFLVLACADEYLGATRAWWSQRLDAQVMTLDDVPDYRQELRDWLRRRSANVVVVRPDRYVLGVADHLDELTDSIADLFAVNANNIHPLVDLPETANE